LESNLTSLSKIFTERLLRIPDYQRGYAWTTKEVSEFWSDLQHLEIGKSHYLGVLTLEDVPSKSIESWVEDEWIIKSRHYSPHFVVDGQQRITTVIILLQSILEKCQSLGDEIQLNYTDLKDIRKKFIYERKTADASRSYLFGYDKDNPSYEYLKRVIFGEPSVASGEIENTIYTQNLSNAKDYFLDQMKDFSLSQVEEVYTKITQHFLFNIYSLDDEIDTFVAFETMNNRGKVLSHLELLKNRLIYLTTKLPTEDFYPDSLRHSINECWKSMYHFLGKGMKVRLDDDEFLYHHYNLYFRELKNEAEEEDIYFDGELVIDLVPFHSSHDHKRALIDDIFSSKPINDKSRTREVTAEFIANYVSSLKQSVQTWYNIHNPYESNYPDDIKEWIARCNKIPTWKNTRLLLLEMLNRPVEKSKTTTLIASIERGLFIGTFLSDPYYFGRVNYSNLALKLKVNNSIDEVITDLKNGVDKLQKSIALSFQTKFKDADFYSWKGIRYFLYDYEYHLQSQSKTQREKLDWDIFRKKEKDSDYITIEHIYPQRARHPYWTEKFIKYNTREKRQFRHALGNLVPLSTRKNSSLSNRIFKEKISRGFRYGCFSENEITEFLEWGPNEIKERSVKLLSYMDRRWDLGLCPPHILKDKDKSKLFYLELIGLNI